MSHAGSGEGHKKPFDIISKTKDLNGLVATLRSNKNVYLTSVKSEDEGDFSEQYSVLSADFKAAKIALIEAQKEQELAKDNNKPFPPSLVKVIGDLVDIIDGWDRAPENTEPKTLKKTSFVERVMDDQKNKVALYIARKELAGGVALKKISPELRTRIDTAKKGLNPSKENVAISNAYQQFVKTINTEATSAAPKDLDSRVIAFVVSNIASDAKQSVKSAASSVKDAAKAAVFGKKDLSKEDALYTSPTSSKSHEVKKPSADISAPIGVRPFVPNKAGSAGSVKDQPAEYLKSKSYKTEEEEKFWKFHGSKEASGQQSPPPPPPGTNPVARSAPPLPKTRPLLAAKTQQPSADALKPVTSSGGPYGGGLKKTSPKMESPAPVKSELQRKFEERAKKDGNKDNPPPRGRPSGSV